MKVSHRLMGLNVWCPSGDSACGGSRILVAGNMAGGVAF